MITQIKKSLFLFSLFLFSISFNSYSQTIFGLKGGVGSTYLIGGDLNKFDIKGNTGFFYNYGLYFTNHISKKSSIQYEFLLQNESFEFKNSDYEFSRDLNYLSLPISYQYWFNKNIYIGTGPYFSYLIEARGSRKNPKGKVFDGPKNDEFKSLNFGFFTSLGVVDKHSGLKIFTRYQRSLNNISKSGNIKSHSFHFGLGISLGKIYVKIKSLNE